MLDLLTLNEGQRQAVTFGKGPLLVLAAAGSGKTKTLTTRVAFLIEQGEDPRSFLVTTFTKKAATEMTERLETLIGDKVLDVQIGTFHSFCLSVLKAECGIRPKDDILPESHKKRMIKGLLGAPSKDYPDAMNWAHDLGAALNSIGRIKNELLSVDAYERQAADNPHMQKLSRLYRLYEKHKGHKIDFDDMLLRCWELFVREPETLSVYQQRFKWLLIDETQDNNLAQWEITKMLSAPQHNITVVGDDDQSVYGFRGARPDQILSFHEMFSGATRIVMGENYRSTENIVDTANALIQHNEVRHKKSMCSMRGVGLDPIYAHCDTPEDEAAFVAEEIEAALKGGYKGASMAVLYRCNAQSRAFEDEMVRRDIPYTIIGSAGFYNRKEIKDIISYLRVIYSPSDTEAVERIINVPNRYLGKAFVGAVKTHSFRSGLSFLEAMTETPGLKNFQFKAADELGHEIRSLQKIADDTAPAKLIYEVRKRFKYDAYLIKEEGGEDGADNNRIENLNELMSAANKFSSLAAFLDFVGKQQNKSSTDNKDPDKVQLMTIHRAKGLEWKIVFLVGVSQGLLPHKNAIETGEDGNIIPESIEEERRLCYVGITRARQILYMSSLNEWQNNHTGPSMFLGEVGLEVEELEAVAQ